MKHFCRTTNLNRLHGELPLRSRRSSKVSLETDAAENWKPSKKKSRERIDGIVALIMALERATCHQPNVAGYYTYNKAEIG